MLFVLKSFFRKGANSTHIGKRAVFLFECIELDQNFILPQVRKLEKGEIEAAEVLKMEGNKRKDGDDDSDELDDSDESDEEANDNGNNDDEDQDNDSEK